MNIQDWKSVLDSDSFKGELICLLLLTCNYVVSVWRGFLFLWVVGMGYVVLFWHSLSLPYNYFTKFYTLYLAEIVTNILAGHNIGEH